MKIRNILLIVSLSFIVLFSSCSKEKVENKIVGTWNQISVGQIKPEGNKVVWTFEDDNTLKMDRYYNGTLSKTSTANWELKMRFGKKNQLEISNYDKSFDLEGVDRDGTYLIHELGDYLKIQRTEADIQAAFLWMEFEKE